MKIVCLESPFKPSAEDVVRYVGRYTEADLLRQNIIYARMALLSCLLRGEAPLASHLLYTQVWSERADLRDAGIKAGIEMHHRCDLVALFRDLGVSKGMQLASDNAKLLGVDQVSRSCLDCIDVDDARAQLAERQLDSFPFLEQLMASEQAQIVQLRKETRPGRGR